MRAASRLGLAWLVLLHYPGWWWLEYDFMTNLVQLNCSLCWAWQKLFLVLEIVLMLDMSCSEFKSFLVYTIQEGQHNFSHLHTSRSFVLLHSGDFYSYSLSVTPRTLYTLLLLLRETINTPNPWWTPSLSLLVSENSPFENILVWTDW